MPTIEERFHELHPKSIELFESAKEVFPSGITHDSRHLEPFSLYMTHGLGPRKWDVDGLEYLDYRTGHGSMILGHAHPDIVAAVADQVARGTHLSASSELEIQWAKWVTHLIPCAEKVRFHSSGTESTMMAFRIARAYTGKKMIIKFTEHFHGWADQAVAREDRGVAGIPAETHSTMIVLPPNDISLVEKTLKENDVAAVMVETTGAHMGQLPVGPEFLRDLRRVTKDQGVLLIFDEVVTGFRVSPGGAQGLYDVTPDMCTLAKILGGGLPGGAVAGKADLIDMLEWRDLEWNATRRVSHQGTFNANPLSAAAGSKALELVATTPVNATADAMAQRMKDGLNGLLADMEVPGCCSGVASMLHLRLGKAHECDKEICSLPHDDIKASLSRDITGPLRLALMNAGVDSTTTILLSATHREQDVDKTISAHEEALTAMRKEGLI